MKNTVLALSVGDLKKIVAWEPTAPGFGRDEENAYAGKVCPILREIERLESARVRVLGDGGLSNYASAFVHNNKNDHGKIKGLYVYLSLLAPIAAMGRDTAYVCGGSPEIGYDMIEPGAVLDANSLESDFEKSVLDAIIAGGYRLLSVEEATTGLPEDIVPYEYCLNDEPWDRVFHALFSDTD
jgi:hypothetical protein